MSQLISKTGKVLNLTYDTHYNEQRGDNQHHLFIAIKHEVIV